MGSIEYASKLFDRMTVRDVVTHTLIVMEHSHLDDLHAHKALRFAHHMQGLLEYLILN